MATHGPEETATADSSRKRARVSLIVRSVSIGTILFLPILSALWQTSSGPEWLHVRGAAPRTANSAARTARPDDISASINEYLARRSPALDSLLPAGAGGTHFYRTLGEDAGLAFANTASIALATDVFGISESTELHERAHLLHAFNRAAVNTLLARLPQPDSGEYAAKNPGEHFAEMAAFAWRLIAPADDVCIADTPVEQLRLAEESVPGTAGFLLWYLRSLSSRDSSGYRDLLDEARSITAPLEAEWSDVWVALENRRRTDGSFTQWEPPSTSEVIDSLRAEYRTSGNLFDRAASVLFLPAALLAHFTPH